jgi:hypothetical protein
MTAVASTDAPLATRCSSAVQQLLGALLARDPAQRPSPADVRAVLARSASQPEIVASPTAALPLEDDFDRTTVLDARPSAAPPRRVVPRPTRPGRRTPWRPVLVGLVLLVVLAAGGLGVWLSQRGSGRTAADPQRPSPSAAATGAASTAPTATSTSAPSAGTASGLGRVSGDGWSLAVPTGWQRSTSGAGTRWSDPAGGRYLLVATRDPAGPSAVGAWRDQEKAFRKSHDGYERLRLETIDDPRASDAADWEFGYADGGARLHALDRAWVVQEVGYAVFVQSRADQWQASQPVFDQVLASFRAAGD